MKSRRHILVSLISPAVFHYVNLFVGIGAGRTARILF